jgi:hypothetical protein
MTIKSLMNLIKQTVVLGLLVLSGCEARSSMRDDFVRLTSAQPIAVQKPPVKSTASQSGPASRGVPEPTVTSNSTDVPAAAAAVISDETPASALPTPPTIALAGKSEQEVRAMLGAPTSEEDRPPGKRWRYRDGRCTLDVQLYPDVHTKQFGTLAYEVKSDDNTDEGKRLCLVQLQSRFHSRN